VGSFDGQAPSAPHVTPLGSLRSNLWERSATLIASPDQERKVLGRASSMPVADAEKGRYAPETAGVRTMTPLARGETTHSGKSGGTLAGSPPILRSVLSAKIIHSKVPFAPDGDRRSTSTLYSWPWPRPRHRLDQGRAEVGDLGTGVTRILPRPTPRHGVDRSRLLPGGQEHTIPNRSHLLLATPTKVKNTGAALQDIAVDSQITVGLFLGRRLDWGLPKGWLEPPSVRLAQIRLRGKAGPLQPNPRRGERARRRRRH
jgi:hypothetical protein